MPVNCDFMKRKIRILAGRTNVKTPSISIISYSVFMVCDDFVALSRQNVSTMKCIRSNQNINKKMN